MFGSDGISWINRPEDQGFNPKFIKPMVKDGGGSCIVWGCFSGFSLGLHIIDPFLYLDIVKIKLVKQTKSWYSAQSSDLNPIENFLEELDRRLRLTEIYNKVNFVQNLRPTWQSIEERTIIKRLESMPRRCMDMLLVISQQIDFFVEWYFAKLTCMTSLRNFK